MFLIAEHLVHQQELLRFSHGGTVQDSGDIRLSFFLRSEEIVQSRLHFLPKLNAVAHSQDHLLCLKHATGALGL